MQLFKILFLFFFLLAQHCYGQFEKNYKPIAFTDTIPEFLNNAIQDKIEAYKSSARSSQVKREVSNFKCKMYDDINKAIVSDVNEGNFIIDDVISPYLQTILNNIYAANPQLPNGARVYAYRSAQENAASLGEGTIIFNLGLLIKLKTESQIAVVLCHELAHYHKQHMHAVVDRLAAINYDKNLKKQIDNTINSYNQTEKLKNIFKKYAYDVTKHSRDTEGEADSVGMSYLLNTSYNPYEALAVMDILDSCDVPTRSKSIDLKKYFSYPSIPFKDAWVESHTPDFVYAHELKENETPDSLKTHPDCKIRKVSLARQIESARKVNSSAAQKADTALLKILEIAVFELVESAYNFNNLGKSVYRALVLLEKYPENIYLHATVGKSLYYLYQFQEQKQLGLTLALPYKFFDNNYNQVLELLNNLRVSELSKISCAYVEHRFPTYKSDEEFLFAMALNSKLPDSQFSFSQMRTAYIEKFPKGKYVSQLKALE